VQFYEKYYQETEATFPEQLIAGGYCKTIISGAIRSFGWDMLLMAAVDQRKFAKVLERFGNYTAHYVAAQAETSIEVFIQHDDIVWTEGPFVSPDFYRKAIFPLYKKMWAPLKKKGKKILFCSDGKIDVFMKDIASCGADGFIFEPVNDFDWIVEHFGNTHVIIGSKSDCRTLTFGTWEQVKKEIDDTLAVAKKCPGFFYAVGNHIPANISDEMCELYINHLKANWNR
jgi:uroporphyrinogen-III decarboxylase